VKKAGPPALSDDDSVKVAYGPFAAHVDKSDISVKQVLSCFLSSLLMLYRLNCYRLMVILGCTVYIYFLR